MNPSIWQRFDRLEQELCTSPIVAEYRILRWEIAQASGQVRVRIYLVGGGLLDFFEYVVAGSHDVPTVSKYRYHWQNSDGNIVRAGIMQHTMWTCPTPRITPTCLMDRCKVSIRPPASLQFWMRFKRI